MKTLHYILGSVLLSIVGTAIGIPAANAIQNRPEKFKNEPFKKVYKEGSGSPRFFAQLDFNGDSEEYGDEYEKCGLGANYNRYLYGLKELKEESIRKMLNSGKNFGTIFMLIEFEKKGDWFNRNNKKSGYLFSYSNKDSRYSNDEWINKLKKFINLDKKSATEEMFSILETKERFFLEKKIDDILLKKKGLFKPLNVETEMLGNCKRIVLKTTHI